MSARPEKRQTIRWQRPTVSGDARAWRQAPPKRLRQGPERLADLAGQRAERRLSCMRACMYEKVGGYAKPPASIVDC